MPISRDISTSGTFQVYPDPAEYYQNRSKEERAKWNNNYNKYQSDNSSVHSERMNGSVNGVGGPGWLNRGLHDLKDSEDDIQSVNSFSYIRGQNVPVDPAILAERVK